ncbi:elongation factor P 5-aminopentanone reductase [Alteribacter populi]|uniref:elongation factor P 5-aminopentanone reductase n=1 Tax=Alteribacter populi TaxID=2011011 RepID=UPI000BBADF39|nr:SDR family oxidoreductase [Alteribacter populi]
MTKQALITGASGEIGRAIALKLAKDGFSLVLHYHQNDTAAQSIAQQINKLYDQKPVLVQADMRSPHAVEKLAGAITNPLDVIVHNSGRSYTGLVQDFSQEELQEATQLGLITPYRLTNAFLPGMIEKKSGKVIVISSIWGLTGASCEVLYSMIKGGLNAYVKALAKELAPSGIQVNGIAPGIIETKMNQHLQQEERDAIAEDIPAGRFGKPAEIAEAVSFLTSPETSYINGQILSVNGAWHC